MIYAFVASIFRDEIAPKRGTGKTCSMTYYLFQDFNDKRRSIANYPTAFAEYLPVTDIIIGMLKEEITNSTVALTEFQQILDELGHPQLSKRIFRTIVSQSRKLENDLYIDTQIFKQAGNDIRDHVDRIFIPKKLHMDGKECLKDRCDYPNHRIVIYCRQPYIGNEVTGELYPIKMLKSENVGKLYDTKKVTIDPIDIEKLLPYAKMFGMKVSSRGKKLIEKI
jgi:hypothetical protein